jgi:hypothetical protein
MDKDKLAQEVCNAVADMWRNCDNDFVGEQRESYNPRLIKAMLGLCELFPVQATKAIANAKLF